MYFSAIKQAKDECWNQFLKGAERKDIFKAFQYTKSRRVERLPILEYGERKLSLLKNNVMFLCLFLLALLLKLLDLIELVS